VKFEEVATGMFALSSAGKCTRCGRQLRPMDPRSFVIKSEVETRDTNWALAMLCTPCSSFSDAAIAGRACWARDAREHEAGAEVPGPEDEPR
jgi:hypothetical protein